jgi:glutaminase
MHANAGVEPSGQAFNAIVCLPDQRPHNPCVNVGAIMTCAVLASASPERTAEEHTRHVMSKWAALCGGTGEVLSTRCSRLQLCPGMDPDCRPNPTGGLSLVPMFTLH